MEQGIEQRSKSTILRYLNMYPENVCIYFFFHKTILLIATHIHTNIIINISHISHQQLEFPFTDVYTFSPIYAPHFHVIKLFSGTNYNYALLKIIKKSCKALQLWKNLLPACFSNLHHWFWCCLKSNDVLPCTTSLSLSYFFSVYFSLFVLFPAPLSFSLFLTVHVCAKCMMNIWDEGHFLLLADVKTSDFHNFHFY